MISRMEISAPGRNTIGIHIMSIDKLERNNRRLDAAAPAATPDNSHIDSAAQPVDGAASRAYAEQMAARFQVYVDWAIANWPVKEQPLDQAAFDRSRDDLIAICRQAGAPVDGKVDPGVPGGAQFVPVTPMPWP
jgi:hypothetical protein